MTLSDLGWDEFFSRSFPPHSANQLVPARVALESRHRYLLLCDSGEYNAECTGALLHRASARDALPAIGDWVAMQPRPGERVADIHAVMPRRTKFSRRASGERADEQIIAANVDTVFLVTALDGNYNLRRIERYLTAAWESGAEPVVVLNKSDLEPELDGVRADVARIASSVPVIAVSAATGDGLEGLDPWLRPARTIALLGSSGVGKSTLINRIVGAERQRTGSVSDAVAKGRHITTRRELVVSPSGVLVIDTPGMRELQLWAPDEDAVDATFADVARLAAGCRFSDCAHVSEPGCAIRAALEDGTLDGDRWQSYQKLQREQAYAARRQDARLARETKQTWRRINRAHRARQQFEAQE